VGETNLPKNSLAPLRLADGSVPEACFLDLDGTLISRSSEKVFLTGLVREGILPPSGFLAFLLGYLVHPLVTLREGKGWNRWYLKGIEPEEIGARAAECAGELLRNNLRKSTALLAEELAEAGSTLVLMSASLVQIAETIGRGLGIGEVMASVPEVSEGEFTGRLSGTRPWGRNKLALAEALCIERGFAMERCAGAGDSWSDRFLLLSCGCPVVVCPDRKLERMARSRGWRTIGGRHTRWA